LITLLWSLGLYKLREELKALFDFKVFELLIIINEYVVQINGPDVLQFLFKVLLLSDFRSGFNLLWLLIQIISTIIVVIQRGKWQCCLLNPFIGIEDTILVLS
jgi:hypothetical protein